MVLKTNNSTGLFLTVVGARLEKHEGVTQIIEKARLASKTVPLFQVVDAAHVAGKQHLLSAFWHAILHFNAGRNISSDLSLEVLLYAAGVRQINQAITSFGIHDSTSTIALIAGSPNLTKLQNVVSEFLKSVSAIQDDSVIEMSPNKKKNLGKKLWGLEEEIDHEAVLRRVAETALLTTEKPS